MVEDNPTDVFVIREALAASGVAMRLHVVEDGHDAMQYLEGREREGCPELVILDLNLPKVPGIEVLRYLRQSQCRGTPVIVVTSSMAAEDRQAVGREGAEAYFQKPNDLKAYMELGTIARTLLERAN